MKNLEELTAIAEAATPGLWEAREVEYECGEFGCTPDGCCGHSTGEYSLHSMNRDEGEQDLQSNATGNFLRKEDACFIATFNPTQILALITRVKELDEALKAMVIIMDRGQQPQKLDEALSWRECDEKARAMADKILEQDNG